MPDIISPAASQIALPRAASPSVLASGVPSLASFIDVMIGKLAPPAPKSATGDGERQDDAGTGKDLPDADDSMPVDPALTWLNCMPAPTPEPITVGVPIDTKPPVMRGLDPDAPPLLPQPITVGLLDTKTPVMRGLKSGAPLTVAVPVSPELRLDKPAPGVTGPAVDASLPFVGPVRAPTAKPDIMPVLVQPRPVLLAPVAPPATVALPALFALATARDRDARDDNTTSPMPAAPATSAVATAPVQPTGDAQRQTLDMSAHDWPQRMIDRIEALRDNANANDTSIRLKPEALGRVDVALRTHDDGAISVRFTADQPATRTLLIDAAPQLTAAAEARGIRLSGTSVDLSGQGDQRPRAQADQPQNITNHFAAPRGDDSQAVDDGRIA